jgi:hypothetical protein
MIAQCPLLVLSEDNIAPPESPEQVSADPNPAQTCEAPIVILLTGRYLTLHVETFSSGTVACLNAVVVGKPLPVDPQPIIVGETRKV